MAQLNLIFVALILSIRLSLYQGCHNKQHGSRKKRQASTDSVERTRELRDFFTACMRDRQAGAKGVDFQSLVDYAILDTKWYKTTDRNYCIGDTVTCWQERLNNYLKQSSSYLPTARGCIQELSIARKKTGRLVYSSSRKKRQSPSSAELLSDYSTCIQSSIKLPPNRRDIIMMDVVVFVRDHAFCGECSENGNGSNMDEEFSENATVTTTFYINTTFPVTVTFPINTTFPITTTFPVNATTPITTTFPVNTTNPITTTFPANTTTSINTTFPVNTTTPTPINTTFPVNTTTPITTTFPVNTTTPITTTFPANTTNPITTTFPVNTTTPIYTTFPVNTTNPITTTFPVNTTTPVATTFPVNTTTLVTTFPVNTTNSNQPVVAIYPFVLQRLTLVTSPLYSSITSCTDTFRTFFLPEGGSPPVIGWSQWSTWTVCPFNNCDVTTHYQKRTRQCPLGVPGTPPCSGNTAEERECDRKSCARWSNWTPWSSCSATCGIGRQESSRSCIGITEKQGCQGESTRSKECNLVKCYGSFTDWTSWTSCSVPCGGGEQSRTRSCVGGPRCRPDSFGIETRQRRTCNSQSCYGSFTDWTLWTSCSVSCGGGEQSRTRSCVGGSKCRSDSFGIETRQRRSCNQRRCRGSWGQWGPFTSCPVTCGGSHTYNERRRSCIGGNVWGPGCFDLAVERRECGRSPCAGPHWQEWSSWTTCTWRRRTRQCVGGPAGSCPGEDVVYEDCGRCNRKPAAEWSPWRRWSKCIGGCNGVRRRLRVCRRGKIGDTGCTGNDIEVESCIDLLKCLV